MNDTLFSFFMLARLLQSMVKVSVVVLVANSILKDSRVSLQAHGVKLPIVAPGNFLKQGLKRVRLFPLKFVITSPRTF